MKYTMSRTFIDQSLKTCMEYDGSQLRPFYPYEMSQERGDGIVAFVGPMCLSPKEMIDMEDVLSNDRIWSPSAINFIIELFHINIETCVLYQRAFMQTIVDDMLAEGHKGKLYSSIQSITLEGDDIMVHDGEGLKKASVSIASVSHISGLMHVGLNLEVDDNIPVPAIGLKNIYQKFNTTFWIENIMSQFEAKIDSIRNATVKVKGL